MIFGYLNSAKWNLLLPLLLELSQAGSNMATDVKWKIVEPNRKSLQTTG